MIDISSILHRMVFGSTKDFSTFTIINGKYRTEDFIKLTLHYIISEIIDIQIKYKNYGELVICFDDYKKDYWRRDVYSEYKLKRRVAQSDSTNPINYKEVYEYTNKLFEQFTKNTPWKCIYVNKAEADDIILVLAKEFYKQKILILSADKDFLQAQRLPGIKQYSALTKKWLVPENKHDNMNHWIHEHVMLGDVADGVPKVTDHTIFSEPFLKHLIMLNKPTLVHKFKKLSKQEKREVLLTYTVQSLNRKGQEIGLNIYENKSFGSSHLKKISSGEWKKTQIVNELKKQKKNLLTQSKLTQDKVLKKDIRTKSKLLTEKINSIKVVAHKNNLQEFLNSHALYNEHYDRNFTLIMEEGIPNYIRKNIMLEYNSADTTYNEKEFNNYLDSQGLHTIKSKLPLVFKSTSIIDITNCGWDF